MGRFLLTQMAAVAELEAGLIGERTKNALAAAKKRIARTGQRGRPDIKRLGNPNGARALKGKQIGNAEAVAKLKATAELRRAVCRPKVFPRRPLGPLLGPFIAYQDTESVGQGPALMHWATGRVDAQSDAANAVAAPIALAPCLLPQLSPRAVEGP
ncbi:Resolvase, N terminal domain [Bradyrhizobium erythrophlei]|jgi:hypothetical protein|nr:Resolvase, N terminal domain [Bradyrhizobium erythrophlei]